MTFAATHVGTATLLLEIAGLRLLTDPVFDPPGRTYRFGWGTQSRRLTGPALLREQLGTIDAVLLSHDQHADNLDDAGRALLPGIPRVLTTVAGARRLGHAGALGLAPFASTTVTAPDGTPLRVTATPARHGPPGSLPAVGHVIGFVIEHERLRGPIYISGDTVWFRGVAEVARRFAIDTAFLHLGGVSFAITGPIKYTFDAAQAVTAARHLGPRRIVPVHYDGWSHFRQPRAEVERVFAAAGLDDRVCWLTAGTRSELS
jgi:L-ascorbate metabolism protein UlaG (beta-lactamase superfamily)